MRWRPAHPPSTPQQPNGCGHSKLRELGMHRYGRRGAKGPLWLVDRQREPCSRTPVGPGANRRFDAGWGRGRGRGWGWGHHPEHEDQQREDDNEGGRSHDGAPELHDGALDGGMCVSSPRLRNELSLRASQRNGSSPCGALRDGNAGVAPVALDPATSGAVGQRDDGRGDPPAPPGSCHGGIRAPELLSKKGLL